MLVTVTEFQGSLLDIAGDGELAPYGAEVARVPLSRGAWVDLRPAWLLGEDVFQTLVHEVGWQADRRRMYDRVVQVPRLLAFYGEDEMLPHPMLTAARDALNDHYGAELGERFVTAGLCYYRDGRDSVAWHADTIGRSRTEDTMVAICSLGADRKLQLRPRGGGGDTRSFTLGHGDVVVIGGSCQRTWEHQVPKTARPVGPRISVQFRVRGVR